MGDEVDNVLMAILRVVADHERRDPGTSVAARDIAAQLERPASEVGAWLWRGQTVGLGQFPITFHSPLARR